MLQRPYLKKVMTARDYSKKMCVAVTSVERLITLKQLEPVLIIGEQKYYYFGESNEKRID